MFNNILFHSQNRLTLPKSKGFGRLYNWYAASSRSRGMLYNWYAATDARNIAPVGWHLPSRTEFENLAAYAGGLAVAGGKLKEVGVTYWGGTNVGATNEYGFNAIETGDRSESGVFGIRMTNLWSSTEYTSADSLIFNIDDNNNIAEIQYSIKKTGYTIRLIKDDSTDIGIMTGNDGKQYATVKIGTQVWMSENLEETKFRNGDTIPVVTDNVAWAALTTAGSCWYNNTRTYNLAPVGWHLPNTTEYYTLITYVGGSSVAGGNLKEIGTEHWQSPNLGATNSSGFTAVASGNRTSGFNAISQYTAFQSVGSTKYEAPAYWLTLYYNSTNTNVGSATITTGYSIRFIRNKNSILTTQPIDAEGNVYETVTIGTQTFTKQNHKSKKWRTGESINVQDIYIDTEWAALTVPACCAYNNDENNV